MSKKMNNKQSSVIQVLFKLKLAVPAMACANLISRIPNLAVHLLSELQLLLRITMNPDVM